MDISALLDLKPNTKIPRLAPGDTVRVRVKVVEGEKERIQVFQGVVIKVNGGGIGSSFTVRRVTYGVGVERTFPFYSPIVDGVEVVRHGKVRRARLYYLRGLSTKQSRIKERRVDASKEGAIAAPAAAEPAPAEAQAEVAAPPVAEASPETAEPAAEATAVAEPVAAPENPPRNQEQAPG